MSIRDRHEDEDPQQRWRTRVSSAHLKRRTLGAALLVCVFSLIGLRGYATRVYRADHRSFCASMLWELAEAEESAFRETQRFVAVAPAPAQIPTGRMTPPPELFEGLRFAPRAGWCQYTVVTNERPGADARATVIVATDLDRDGVIATAQREITPQGIEHFERTSPRDVW